MSPPSKRRRLQANPDLLAFLDLEAQVENVSEEEEEGEENLQDLIDDTVLDDDGPSLYSRPIPSSTDEEHEQRYMRRIGRPIESLAHDERRDLEEEEEEDLDDGPVGTTYTKEFMRRIGGPSEGFAVDDERRAPGVGDALWEIGCKIGSEEDVVFKIGAMLMDNPTGSQPIRSVVGRKSLPGRIYVELTTQAEAVALAQTLDELSSAKIRRLGFEELLAVLIETKPVYCPQTWRRILGPWKALNGDIALVVELEECFFILAVPRIRLYSDENTGDRVPRKLCKVEDLEQFLGRSISVDSYGYFKYKDRNYTPQGYFVEYLHNALLSDEVLPSLDELNSFKECRWLHTKTYESTALLISQRNLKPHDRVKIIAGDFRDLVGHVIEVSEHEVEVYLPSQDATERILLESIRPHFTIGDEVKLLDKDHDGVTAWVVGIVAGGVKVMNLEMSLEITMSVNDVEFYSPPHLSTLRIRKPKDDASVDGAVIDPHRRYIGRRVTAVGSLIVKQKHPYRGYHGTIKNTATDGSIWVELDAMQQKVVKFDINQLCLYDEGNMNMDTTPFPTFRDPGLNSLSPSSAAETNTADCDLHEVLESNLTSTPLPSCTVSDNISPACNPLAQIPRSSVLPWLRDPLMTKVRLKMVEEHGNGAILEFLKLCGEEVQVREGAGIKTIPITALRAVLPTKKDDLVVPTIGDMRGVLFKIREHGEDICVAKRPGTRLKKGEMDPSFATVDLVQVFPPLNRRSTF